MQKILIPAIAAIGITSVATPIVLLNKDNVEKPDSIPELTSAKDIQTKYQQMDCFKQYFKEVEWPQNGNTNSTLDSNPLFSDSSAQSKGCLIIEHNKQTYAGKWKGEFKLVWAVSNGIDGFILVVTAKTEAGKIYADSSAYITKKESNAEKWTVSHSKVNDRQEATTKEKLAELLPKAGIAIQEFSEKKDDFWDFKPDLNNICNSNECTNVNPKPNKKSFTWYLTSSSSQAWNWCDNFSSWFTKLFNWNYISNKLQSIFGNWTKQ